MREKGLNSTGGRTARLTGTAILAAMVIVFDYSLKYSGLKIPFPWMPFLKFDFTGIPIVLSLLLYGWPSSAITSLAGTMGIVARSGDLIGGAMKGIAEFSTVAGMAIGLYIARRTGLGGYTAKVLSVVIGLVFRIVVMSGWNLVILPAYYGVTYNAAVGMLYLLGIFNSMQGAISTLLGYALYEAYTRRVPTAKTGLPGTA
jgi:riboflavin transporter FmnP